MEKCILFLYDVSYLSVYMMYVIFGYMMYVISLCMWCIYFYVYMMEDHPKYNTTINERQPSLEDELRWYTSFDFNITPPANFKMASMGPKNGRMDSTPMFLGSPVNIRFLIQALLQ